MTIITKQSKTTWEQVVPSGFEPESPAPKASMIDHYTTGLYIPLFHSFIKKVAVRQSFR